MSKRICEQFTPFDANSSKVIFNVIKCSFEIELHSGILDNSKLFYHV